MMILTNNKNTTTDNFDALSNTDHLWVIKNFKRTSSSHESLEISNILKRYAAKDTLDFDFGPSGKPFLTGAHAQVQIGLSHSKDILMLALSLKPIGVDVEFLKERKGIEQIRARYFGEEEQSQDLTAFYHSWTAREAFIKAIGSTIGKTLRNIAVKVGEGNEGLRIGVGDEFSHGVVFLKFYDGYLAAICRAAPILKPLRVFEA